ncbi:MAG: YbaK/EbsC family protein [Paracoccus sp. (in: a-proteobacteria)]|nr:YbaK/EbsC family protein [Paracoccus sp. (in: a-proteobacteria)]
MSRSLARVRAALQAAGLADEIREMGDTRTAADAALAVGCLPDQIAKSIIFHGDESGDILLFLTAGGNRVDAARAAELAGEALCKADAALIRAATGFAIGGVAPLGHLRAPRAFIDLRLMEFGRVWAAAGTPRHVFSIAPPDLIRVSGAQPAAFTA